MYALKYGTVPVVRVGGGLENSAQEFRSKTGKGTGVGLSICREIIENHGRTIRVENQLGKRLIVYLHLPLQNSPDYYKN